MKIVISTKVLSGLASKAIENVSSSFKVCGKDSWITFEGNIEGVGTFIEARPYEEYEGVFYAQQWSNIRDFVSQLEEQPIVIYFERTQNGRVHEKPSITLMQFEKSF